MFIAQSIVQSTNNLLKNRRLGKNGHIIVGVSCLSSWLSKEPEASCRRVMSYVMENIAKTMEETG